MVFITFCAGPSFSSVYPPSRVSPSSHLGLLCPAAESWNCAMSGKLCTSGVDREGTLGVVGSCGKPNAMKIYQDLYPLVN